MRWEPEEYGSVCMLKCLRSKSNPHRVSTCLNIVRWVPECKWYGSVCVLKCLCSNLTTRVPAYSVRLNTIVRWVPEYKQYLSVCVLKCLSSKLVLKT